MKPEKINREKMRNPEKNKSILMMFYLKKRLNPSRSFKNKEKKLKSNYSFILNLKHLLLL